MVNGDLTNRGLYICIPENIRSVNIDDITKDVALFTAEINKKTCNVACTEIVISSEEINLT